MVAHVPTDALRAQVKALASFGVPRGKIAAYIGIGEPTLRKYYWTELESAEVDKICQISDCLFQQALNGNVSAMMFYLKTRAQWRETARKDDEEAQVEEQKISRVQIEVVKADTTKG